MSKTQTSVYIYKFLPITLQNFIQRVDASAIGTRIVRGALWSLSGAVITRLFSLASFVLIARVLGKEDFGKFGIIQSTIVMFGVFAGFGLGQTATKYIALYRETNPERAGRIIGMVNAFAAMTGSISAVLMFTFSPWLAERTLANPSLSPLLRISSLLLFFEAMNGAQIGVLSGLELFKTSAKISLWTAVASFCMMVAGIFWGGLAGCVWALNGRSILNWLLNQISIRQTLIRFRIPHFWWGSKNELSILWNFSFPSMLSGFMVSPTLWICNAMLVNRHDGYTQMGIFAAANSFQQMLLVLATTLSAPLLPMLSNMVGSNTENDRLSRINILSTWVLGSFPALLLLAIPEIGAIVFGSDFQGQEFTYTFLLVVFCSSIVIYKQGLSRVLSAHGLMWWGLLSNLVWAAAMITGTKVLIIYGSFGYAIAYATAYVLNTLLFVPLYTRKRLVPKNTIVSREAGFIWSMLLCCMILNFLHTPLLYRVMILPFAIGVLCWSFLRITRNGA
ncbi:MAG: oligosaccharide flippase family protein [Chitinivibrionales bacterium]|nr:oligosaccharide flippase family protein [Chitinivibrionales bacterium]